jgi:hypothetical protein
VFPFNPDHSCHCAFLLHPSACCLHLLSIYPHVRSSRRSWSAGHCAIFYHTCAIFYHAVVSFSLFSLRSSRISRFLLPRIARIETTKSPLSYHYVSYIPYTSKGVIETTTTCSRLLVLSLSSLEI